MLVKHFCKDDVSICKCSFQQDRLKITTWTIVEKNQRSATLGSDIGRMLVEFTMACFCKISPLSYLIIIKMFESLIKFDLELQ